MPMFAVVNCQQRLTLDCTSYMIKEIACNSHVPVCATGCAWVQLPEAQHGNAVS